MGSEIISQQIETGTDKKRVGCLPQTRAPMREGIEIFATETSKKVIGKITSGGFGPTVGYPISMGYIAREFENSQNDLFGELRGKRVPVKIAKIPLKNYYDSVIHKHIK